MPPRASFAVGEEILAIDKGCNYTAIVLKAINVNQAWKYFIHFSGWSRKYDKWLDESEMSKPTNVGDKNTKKKKRGEKDVTVKHEENVETTEVGAVSSESSASSSSSATETLDAPVDEETILKKARRGIVIVSQEEIAAKNKKFQELINCDVYDDDDQYLSSSKVQLPFQLKKHLVDEWQLITQGPPRLLMLPRSPNVKAIIDEFLSFKKEKADDEQYQSYVDLFLGLRVKFDKALPTLLLYRQEREQWAQAERFSLYL